MTEIYWITRLGVVADIFQIFWALSLIVACVVVLICCIARAAGDEDFQFKKLGGYIKRFAFAFAFLTIGVLFVPDKKQLMAIYGIGGTIDYIKSNDKAKELPDKCVEALMRYVESIENENKDNN